MRQCPYCGYSNYEYATECRKCQSPLVAQQASTVHEEKVFWVGPLKAHTIRSKALSLIVLGVLMKVYWGGYGPWPALDNPTLADIRKWLEPLFIYGGTALYVLGLIVNWI